MLFGRIPKGVRFADELLGFNLSDVDLAFQRGSDQVLLIVHEIYAHHHCLRLFVHEERLSGLPGVEQANPAIGTTGGDLDTVIAKNRVVCLGYQMKFNLLACRGRAVRRLPFRPSGPTPCRRLRERQTRASCRPANSSATRYPHCFQSECLDRQRYW